MSLKANNTPCGDIAFRKRRGGEDLWPGTAADKLHKGQVPLLDRLRRYLEGSLEE